MSDTNLNDANFTPTIPDSEENTNQQTYSATGSFRFWCQKVLPLVYDDSLSYYELLCKVVNYLNNVIQNVDNLNTSVTNTNTAFDNLQDYVNDTKDTLILVYSKLEQYVNDYFNNLDVQNEINTKLDEMADNGSLSELLSPFIPSLVSDWLSKNITPTSPAIDASLSVSGAGADAKVTGEQIGNLKSAITQESVSDSIQKYTTNSKSLNLDINGYDSQYLYSGLIWTSGKKLLVSLRLKPSVAATYYISAIKPNQSGWVKSDIKHRAFSANEEAVINVLYTTTADCFITVRGNNSSTATGEIEMYIYDITDYNGASDIELGTTLYKYGIAYNSNNAKFADYAEKSVRAEQADVATESTDAYKLFTKKKTFSSNVTGQGWSRSIGFFGWQFNHTYLFVLDDDEGLVSDGKVIGFLASKSKYAGRFQWTKHFTSGGGYVVCTPPSNSEPTNSPHLVSDNSVSLDINITVYDITGLSLTETEYDLIFKYGQDVSAFNIIEYIFDNYEAEDKLNNSWRGKNVLFIGDSLTEANTYQETVASNLGINYTNHCKGGYGIITLIDGQGSLPALSVADVMGKDLIVLYAGYNNRGSSAGQAGDVYPTNSTIAGYMQYAINKIYELLATANNLTCHIMIVTVDCAGKYPWIDADGYTEYPSGSGQTMETIANVQKAVADYNSLPCVDLWHNSGINRNTWTVFGKQPGAYIDEPTEPEAPYPHNGDQLHKSPAGYKRIGECITGGILDAYGN